MTREKFERIQAKRGYTVNQMGLMTMLTYEDNESVYTAIHFWNQDGTPNTTEKPFWRLVHK